MFPSRNTSVISISELWSSSYIFYRSSRCGSVNCSSIESYNPVCGSSYFSRQSFILMFLSTARISVLSSFFLFNLNIQVIFYGESCRKLLYKSGEASLPSLDSFCDLSLVVGELRTGTFSVFSEIDGSIVLYILFLWQAPNKN